MDISVGLDIATSISVIAAAVSFIISNRKENIKKKSEFDAARLKDMVQIINDYRLKFYKITEKFKKANETEKTQYFNEFMDLMNEFLFVLNILKDVDMIIYSNVDENKLFMEIVNYIQQTNDIVNEVSIKYFANSVSQDDIKNLYDIINSFDKKLSFLVKSFSSKLHKRLL